MSFKWALMIFLQHKIGSNYFKRIKLRLQSNEFPLTFWIEKFNFLLLLKRHLHWKKSDVFRSLSPKIFHFNNNVAQKESRKNHEEKIFLTCLKCLITSITIWCITVGYHRITIVRILKSEQLHFMKLVFNLYMT